MRGNDKVIAQLNEALAKSSPRSTSISCTPRCVTTGAITASASFIKKQSIDEMKHAEELIERLLFLDATPKMDYMELNVGADVKEQLEADLSSK